MIKNKIIQKISKFTFVPIEKECDIKCNISDCAGGMGLAGNGHCFLGGNPYTNDCSKFISDVGFEGNQYVR